MSRYIKMYESMVQRDSDAAPESKRVKTEVASHSGVGLDVAANDIAF